MLDARSRRFGVKSGAQEGDGRVQKRGVYRAGMCTGEGYVQETGRGCVQKRDVHRTGITYRTGMLTGKRYTIHTTHTHTNTEHDQKKLMRRLKRHTHTYIHKQSMETKLKHDPDETGM